MNQPNVNAFLQTLETSSGSATSGGRAIMAQIARNASPDVLPLCEIFYGLADGYEDSLSNRALCRILGHLCKWLTPTGALIVLAIGIGYSLNLVKRAAGSVLASISSIINAMEHPIDTATSWISNIFSPVKKDGVTSAMTDVLSAMIVSDIPAPIAVAAQALGTLGTSNRSVTPSVPSAAAGDDALAAAIANGIIESASATPDNRVNRRAVYNDARRMLATGLAEPQIKENLIRKYGIKTNN